MKYENYELITSMVMPCCWYEEGDEQESYYIDSQTCYYQKFFNNEKFNTEEKETRKWWIIQLYKPAEIENLTEDQYHLCKWLVSECYHDMNNIYDREDQDIDYEKYEWNFKNHCIEL